MGAAVLVGATALGLAAPAAQATVIERGTFPTSGTFTETCDRGTTDPTDDFEIFGTSSGEATFSVTGQVLGR
jgi:hypothetical protein